jgi:tetratricopeptide (TPR) repeat protein
LTANLIASGYKKLKNYDKAEKVLERHLSMRPKDDGIRIMLAELQMKSNPTSAIMHYEHLVRLGSKNFVILNNIALLYYNDGQYEKADGYINEALVIKQNSADILHTSALIKFALGLVDASLTHISEASSLKPNDSVIKGDLFKIKKGISQ